MVLESKIQVPLGIQNATPTLLPLPVFHKGPGVLGVEMENFVSSSLGNSIKGHIMPDAQIVIFNHSCL